MIAATWGHPGATAHPGTAAGGHPAGPTESGIVAFGRTRNRGKASGVETETPLALVTKIRDGKTISIRAYLDRDEALEAAGLSE